MKYYTATDSQGNEWATSRRTAILNYAAEVWSVSNGHYTRPYIVGETLKEGDSLWAYLIFHRNYPKEEGIAAVGGENNTIGIHKVEETTSTKYRAIDLKQDDSCEVIRRQQCTN